MNSVPCIAFIDSGINVDFIKNFLSPEQHIDSVLTVKDGEIIASGDRNTNVLLHASICCKLFLENYNGNARMHFLELLDEDACKGDIDSLARALSWCLENDVDIINLSIGTTRMSDAAKLFDVIEKLIAKKTVVVAANSNEGKMTFPAFFSDVYGVRAIKKEGSHAQFIYTTDSKDGISINCYVDDQTLCYKGTVYSTPCSNSLAAPIISAKICDFLNGDVGSVDGVRNFLKNQAILLDEESFSEMYTIQKKYEDSKIEIPTLFVIGDDSSDAILQFALTLLSDLSHEGYEGICLSGIYKTDFASKILNISRFQKDDIKGLLNFYSHYCKIDFIVLHGKERFIFEDFSESDVDVVIFDSSIDDAYLKFGINQINIHKNKNFKKVVDDVIKLLV